MELLAPPGTNLPTHLGFLTALQAQSGVVNHSIGAKSLGAMWAIHAQQKSQAQSSRARTRPITATTHARARQTAIPAAATHRKQCPQHARLTSGTTSGRPQRLVQSMALGRQSNVHADFREANWIAASITTIPTVSLENTTQQTLSLFLNTAQCVPRGTTCQVPRGMILARIRTEACLPKTGASFPGATLTATAKVEFLPAFSMGRQLQNTAMLCAEHPTATTPPQLLAARMTLTQIHHMQSTKRLALVSITAKLCRQACTMIIHQTNQANIKV